MSWEYSRRVKYYETDRMGVVHHSNYLRIIEDARMEWLRDNFMSYSELEKMGVIIPTASASGKFVSYLRYDDEFKVIIRLVQFKGVRMEFEYEIINSVNGQLCYTGESTHFFAVDGNYKPYLSFRSKFPELYQKMCLLHEKDTKI
ncbi:MAG TPA: acyl-CoA thioesterase [Ruminococcus sp.]|nr:acyl-CoA thioesterase [Ruminococcus sp.]